MNEKWMGFMSFCWLWRVSTFYIFLNAVKVQVILCDQLCHDLAYEMTLRHAHNL
jgi:hypothetical protein